MLKVIAFVQFYIMFLLTSLYFKMPLETKTTNITRVLETISENEQNKCTFKENINFKNITSTTEQQNKLNKKVFKNDEELVKEIVDIINKLNYGEHIMLSYDNNEKAIEILKLNIVVFRKWKYNTLEKEKTAYNFFRSIDVDKDGKVSLLEFYKEFQNLK